MAEVLIPMLAHLYLTWFFYGILHRITDNKVGRPSPTVVVIVIKKTSEGV